MLRRFRCSLPKVVMLGGLVFAAACDSKSPTDPGIIPEPVTAVSVSAPTTTVPIGTTVQLSAAVSPSSVSQNVVWTTSDALRASVNASGLVTAITPGTVRITATSALDGTKSGSVDLTLTGCLALVQANVASGGTLAQDTCYEVVSALSVNGGTLLVQPGVRVQFGPNGSLSIATAGRLNASGTALKPILFTSIDPVGVWRGVRFDDSRGADNILRYVTIERAGSSGWSGAVQSRSVLLLEGSSLVNIQHSTFANSGGTGISLYGDAEMVFTDNTLRDNAIAAWVHPTTAQYIAGSTTFTGNAANVVRTAFTNNDVVRSAQTWRRLSVPYEIQTRMYVEAPLTLEAGVTVSSLDDVPIIVRNQGTLTALGTAAQPIRLTSQNSAPDSWKGLQLTTASANNRFDHVIFENGGSEAWTGNTDSRAMVYMDASSKAVFTNSTFRGSGHYALWVPAGGDIAGFDGNTFVQNARTIIVHPNRAGGISANNSFMQNAENAVRMTFGNTDAVSVAQTWRDFGVPFFVQNRTSIEAAVSIDEGVEFEFAQDASFMVEDEGSLRANGTAANPIAFSGREDLTGYWKGIEYATVSPLNVLRHVNIRNAGSEGWFGGANAIASINVTGDGSLALDTVSFELSGGYAVIVRPGGLLSCTDVTHNGFMFYIYSSAGNGASSVCPL